MGLAGGTLDRGGGDGAPQGICTPRDLLTALREHPRLSQYTLGAHDDGGVCIRHGELEVLVAWPQRWRDLAAFEPELQAAAHAERGLILVGTDPDFAGVLDTLRDRAVLQVVVLPTLPDRLEVSLRNGYEGLVLRRRAADYKEVNDELLRVARSLASERDVRKLLAAILRGARELTGADAGSVYVLEGDEKDDRDRELHFMLSQNDSVVTDFSDFRLPVDGKSIVGAAVLTRQPINLPDLYGLEFSTNPFGFKHDRSFDERIHYQTRSMLTVPMLDAHDDVIGVIQLINKKREPDTKLTQPSDFNTNVIPFDAASEKLALALATQAGVSLENALLYAEVRELFEGFVHASVIAIESRDPTTSGHSQRVGTLTVELAKTVDGITDGRLAPLKYDFDDLKQIEYAGLLHDFGKVGVREKVLVKAKKLYEYERDLILARFDYIRKAIEADWLGRKCEAARSDWPALDEENKARLAEIDRYVALILRSNEPSVLPEGDFKAIAEVAQKTYRTPAGDEKPYLGADEVKALSLPRGTLTDVERIEIESHVTHTYNFLRKIPWGRQFKDIPMIAGSHHETLDGRGYPRHLLAEQIPWEAKMMSIADIFDALTASDRPYKKAIPVEKALSIIESEVKNGRLDVDLFRVFVEAQVYRRVIG